MLPTTSSSLTLTGSTQMGAIGLPGPPGLQGQMGEPGPRGTGGKPGMGEGRERMEVGWKVGEVKGGRAI